MEIRANPRHLLKLATTFAVPVLVFGLAVGLAVHLVHAMPETIPPQAVPADAYAALNPNGSVVVTGRMDCAPYLGQMIRLRVTVTQPATGALAEGSWQKTCASDVLQWSIALSPSTSAAFQLGPAEVAAIDYYAMHQWIGIVTLVTSLPPGPLAQEPPATTVLLAQNSSLGPILTDWQGYTLYMNSNDPPDQSTCSGNCAAIWLPLPGANPSRLSLPPGVGGTLGVITRADGTQQLTYNQQPLYLYSGDNNLGDTNGQGVDGVWSVVTPQPGP